MNKIKPPKEKIPKKRVKVDLKAHVISHENAVKELEEKERKKGDKNQPPKKKSKSEYDKGDINKNEFEDDQLLYKESDEEFSSEEDELHEEKDEEIFICPKSVESCINHLKKVWISLEPPTDEKVIIGCWYAAIYIGKKSSETALYIGLVQKRYLQDENGPKSALELDCLQRKLGTNYDILESHDI